MWNELVKDGEIVTDVSDGLINSAGVLAKKGMGIHNHAINMVE